MLLRSDYGHEFDSSGQHLNTTLIQVPPCSSQIENSNVPFNKFVTTKLLNLNFEFNYNIILNTKTPKEEYGFAKQMVHFEHTFEIKNEGVSPTNKDIGFFVYVPKMVQEFNIKEITIHPENQAQCETSEITNAEDIDYKEKLGQLFCDTVPCNRFSCLVKQGLVKNKPVEVIVRMKFDPMMNKTLYAEHFEIMTKLKLLATGDEIISQSAFKKNEGDVGSSETIQKWWPIALGILIGTVIFGGAMYGLYKKGMFSKLRIFDNKMED